MSFRALATFLPRMLLGLLLAAGAAHAQQAGGADAGVFSRPDEDALFGGEESSDPAPPAPPAEERPRPDEERLFGAEEEAVEKGEAPAPRDVPEGVPQTAGGRDERVLAGPATVSAFEREEAVDDPLRIGGQFYFRGQTSWLEDTRFSKAAVNAPTLLDVYLDGRPSDRIRGFASGRVTYDASLPLSSGATTSGGAGAPSNPSNPSADPTQGSGTPTAGSGLGAQARANPGVLLDQAWLRFDIARAVFLTVGKQHVRWGVSRFFIPTDFLSPQRRDPLAVFDTRVGASMVKVHVPLEEQGWNFYAIGLLDNAGPANVLGQVGGALRAEVLVGSAEVGVGAVVQRTLKPRYALDVSMPLGPLDVYGELALRVGSDRPVYRLKDGFDPMRGLDNFETVDTDGLNPQGTLGATYTLAYSEQDTVTLGAEYFYNGLGVDDPRLYPFLLLQGQFVPFYTARHYGALYAVLTDPGPLERTTFVATTLGNLSDRSFVSRVDFLYRALQFLQVEAFASVNYGHRGGEFRFALDLENVPVGGGQTLTLKQAAPVASVGLGLRINI